MPHGSHIHKTPAYISIDKMCDIFSYQHDMPHCKYVFSCYSKCPNPTRNSIVTSKIHSLQSAFICTKLYHIL